MEKSESRHKIHGNIKISLEVVIIFFHVTLNYNQAMYARKLLYLHAYVI